MRTVLRSVLVSIFLGAVTTTAQLHAEIMLDGHLLRAEDAIRESDPAAARAAMHRIGALLEEHEIDTPPTYHYRYANVWNALGVWDQSLASAVRYLTFERCAAYAADQDADSSALGWAESYSSATAAQQAAVGECSSRGGGSGCIVRVWGCNGPVVEEGLGLGPAARREVQESLHAAGFDPGGADGIFGPRTRAAIRSWQSSRGARATGYLDVTSVTALRPPAAGQPTFRQRGPSSSDLPSARASASVAQQQASPPASAEQETVFWQSIVNSTDPADFEAYLEVFPNGVFRRLAENRLSALRATGGNATAVSRPAGGAGSPVAGSRVAGAPTAAASGTTAGVDPAWLQPGDVFRDCDECPEMVVLAGGGLAMGRYEVTVGEYRAFASATGGGSGGRCTGLVLSPNSWRDPGFPQTDRHPVMCVSWADAQEYVSWLSRRTGASYRLPSEAEWERAASGSPQPGCDWSTRRTLEGTCPVGQYGANAAGLSDMGGNLSEWTSDCWEGDCGRRVWRGSSWTGLGGTDSRYFTYVDRTDRIGFRVSRTLD